MVARRGWWFSSAGFFTHINAYKFHRPASRSMTGLAAGGLARRLAARSMTGAKLQIAVCIAHKLGTAFVAKG